MTRCQDIVYTELVRERGAEMAAQMTQAEYEAVEQSYRARRKAREARRAAEKGGQR